MHLISICWNLICVLTSSLPPALAGSHKLMEEQAIFINNLHSPHVPAAEIGGLMEIIRRERAGSLGSVGGAQMAGMNTLLTTTSKALPSFS